MKNTIAIIISFFLCLSTFAQAVPDSGKSKIATSPDYNQRASIFNPAKLGQSSALSMGYYSSGNSSGSILSYLHQFDYALKPNLKTSAALQIARIGSGGIYRTELLTSVKLDWKPTKNTSFTLDLRLPPQTLSGSLSGPINQGR